ncbi:tether containing UBX domain for GLUT4 isoform X2 [Amblyraja radiata]|uniref:tether containing UBX domain for GLUT4 isoform X2 n=1 Tax=Amblyraja radiata TaxID=386614 RepID=UPI001403353E|nr:tether containing UBX domain for GLUT4 isoform X2 [Amblyraja radiata]
MAAAGVTTVTVLAPNGRRQQVKVAAGTRLLQVLEEVCRKHSLDPEEYALKFQRTVLDLSQQWRFANVPNNAKLEMVAATRQRVGTETKVRIALQLEDGSRLQHVFPSSLTLWNLLDHFPQSRVADQQLLEAIPVCVYMRDEIAGESALKKTTLKSIGLIDGSAIIRYVLKKPSVDGQDDLMDLVASSDEHPVNKSSTVATGVVDGAPAESDSVHSMDDSNPKELIREVNSSGTGEAVVEQKDLTREPSKEAEATSQRNEGGKESPTEKVRSEPSEKPCHSTEKPATPGPVHPPEPDSSALSKEQNHSPVHHEIPLGDLQPDQSEACGHQLTTNEPLRASASVSCAAGPPHPKKSKTVQSSPERPDDIQPLKSETCEVSSTKEYLKPVDREALVYHLDMKNHHVQVGPELEELPDEFFQVTVDDVRKRFAQLKSARQFFEEAPLMTKSMRDSQMIEKTTRYPKVVLRVQFPDRHVLQGFFRPLETVGALMEFVKMHLKEPGLSFYLFKTPPKDLLSDPMVTLFQANLFPAALVHFGSEVRMDHYLCEEFLKPPISVSQADLALIRNAAPSTSSLPSDAELQPCASSLQDEETRSEAGTAASASGSKPAPPNKVPKWLKLPGKP